MLQLALRPWLAAAAMQFELAGTHLELQVHLHQPVNKDATHLFVDLALQRTTAAAGSVSTGA
jgi:hypothetical protein